MSVTLAIAAALARDWCMIASMADSKAALRGRIRAARAARTTAQREAVAAGLLAAARGAGLLADRSDGGPGRPLVLACYLAADGEPDPAGICRAVRASGGTVLLPTPLAGGRLAWSPDDGRRGAHGRLAVPVPVAPAVGEGAEGLLRAGAQTVLAPALAVDLSGARLGQGGGYYDRLLADLGSRVPVLAVVHDDEVLPAGSIPTQAHDRPVSGALTPTRMLSLG